MSFVSEQWKTTESFQQKGSQIRVKLGQDCLGINMDKDKKERVEGRMDVIN